MARRNDYEPVLPRSERSEPVVPRGKQDKLFAQGIQQNPEYSTEKPVPDVVRHYQEKGLNYQDPRAGIDNQPQVGQGEGETFTPSDIYEPQFKVYNTLVDTYNALLVNGSDEEIDAAEAALDSMKPPGTLPSQSSGFTPDQIRGRAVRLHLDNSLVGYDPQSSVPSYSSTSLHSRTARKKGSHHKGEDKYEGDSTFVGGKYRSKGRHHKSKKIYRKNKRSMKRKNSKRRGSMKRGKR
jgi:hypothetical protein